VKAFDDFDRNKLEYVPSKQMIANLGNLIKLFILSNTPCNQKTIKLLQELVK